MQVTCSSFNWLQTENTRDSRSGRKCRSLQSTGLGFPSTDMRNRDDIGVFDMTRKFIALLVIGACLFASSCGKAPPTWSVESKSPDGKMIATARTHEQSGFGTGWAQTTVDLNWTTGSQPPTVILAFSDGPSGPGGMNVGMKWLTPTCLELAYKGRRPIDFQAVKCDGVEITVRDVAISP